MKKLSTFSREARKGQTLMTEIMRQGEKAAIQSLPISSNPYAVGTEDSELWIEGYNDAIQKQRWNFIEGKNR